MMINRPLYVAELQKLEMTGFMEEDVKFTLWTHETDIWLKEFTEKKKQLSYTKH